MTQAEGQAPAPNSDTGISTEVSVDFSKDKVTVATRIDTTIYVAAVASAYKRPENALRDRIVIEAMVDLFRDTLTKSLKETN